MSKRDTGTDDPRVRVRAGKSSRPRTKRRPDYSDAQVGHVVAIDRGRFTVSLPEGGKVQAIKARELGRGAVVMGDKVRLTGDLSGRVDTLCRIVQIDPRHHVLRRSLEEAAEDRGEKIIVANADLLVIVTAAANPEPRTGMVERCLVAAAEAEIPAVLCVTKSDVGDPADFIAQFAGFDLTVVETSCTQGDEVGLAALQALLTDHFSVLVGHSGVGKSTLINALIPDANRAVGEVSDLTGKGRHTSTSAVAFEMPGGGWVIDTPGVRSFGLSHAHADDVLTVFPDLFEVTSYCLPNCTHLSTEVSCALDQWAAQNQSWTRLTGGKEKLVSPEFSPGYRKDLVERARALLAGIS